MSVLEGAVSSHISSAISGSISLRRAFLFSKHPLSFAGKSPPAQITASQSRGIALSALPAAAVAMLISILPRVSGSFAVVAGVCML